METATPDAEMLMTRPGSIDPASVVTSTSWISGTIRGWMRVHQRLWILRFGDAEEALHHEPEGMVGAENADGEGSGLRSNDDGFEGSGMADTAGQSLIDGGHDR